MADKSQKVVENVPGRFYVDVTCIDCDLCRNTAPLFFTRKYTVNGGITVAYESLDGIDALSFRTINGRCDLTLPKDEPFSVNSKSVNGGGDAEIQRASIFSTGCVYNRSKIQMTQGEIDLAYLGDHIGYVVRRAQLAIFKDFIQTLAPVDIRPALMPLLTK